MSESKYKVMTGNESCTLGAIAAGMRFFAGYPITPATEIAEYASKYLPKAGGKYILRFHSAATDQPVISDIAKKFDISFNIRAAGIQSVQENKVGTLIMDFDGEAAELAKVMAYLKDNDISVEEAE